METSEIIPFVTAGLLLLAAFVFFIINFVIMYHRRQLQNLREQEGLKHQFQQELLRTQMEIQEQTLHHHLQGNSRQRGPNLKPCQKYKSTSLTQSETTDKQLLAEVKQNIGKAMSDLRDLAKSLNSDHIQLVSLRDLIAPGTGTHTTQPHRGHIAQRRRRPATNGASEKAHSFSHCAGKPAKYYQARSRFCY